MTLHQPNDIIAQRYRIVTPLEKGGMGISYEAEDLTNYQRVTQSCFFTTSKRLENIRTFREGS